jgi:hypothetical protein
MPNFFQEYKIYLGDVFGILAKDIIVKGSGGQAELVGLLRQRLDDFRVAMSYQISV